MAVYNQATLANMCNRSHLDRLLSQRVPRPGNHDGEGGDRLLCIAWQRKEMINDVRAEWMALTRLDIFPWSDDFVCFRWQAIRKMAVPARDELDGQFGSGQQYRTTYRIPD